MVEAKFDQLIENILTPHEEFTPIPFWFLNDELNQDKLKSQLKDFKEKGVDGVVLHPRIGLPKDLDYLSEAYFKIIYDIVEMAKDLQIKIVLYDEGMYPSGSANGKVVAANPEFASLGITLTKKTSEGKVIASFADGLALIEQKSGGTIRGIHFGADDGEPNAPLAADILNPDAVNKFMELVHEQHYHYLKKYFGTTIIGMFTDEPCPLGRNTKNFCEWTTGFEDEIQRAGGKLAELRDLFTGASNPTTKIYKKLIREKLNEVYYKKLAHWCEKHQIMLMGHPAESDDINEQKYFHIPGQDLILRRLGPETGGINGRDSVQGKCSADVARHLGRRRNANECFGVCVRDQIPWYFTALDMKWYIDWLGVRGVNLFIPHAFYYSLRGARKDERPPDVGPHNIWWNYYKLFSDYMKRIAYLMTDSQNMAQIGILCESGKLPYQEVIPLYENQIEFNYIPKISLEGISNVQVSSYPYPYVLDANSDQLEKEILTVMSTVKRDFQLQKPYPGLRVTHLVKQGFQMYFLFNESDVKIDTNVLVPVKGQLAFIDLWKGQVYQIPKTDLPDQTEFHLELDRYETALLVFNPQEKTDIPEKPASSFLGNLDHLFQLIAHEPAHYKKTYTASLEINKRLGTEVFEVTGQEMAECFCNGVFAGVSFFEPHRFPIGDLLHEGDNQLTIMMTGNLANKYSLQIIPYGIGQS